MKNILRICTGLCLLLGINSCMEERPEDKSVYPEGEVFKLKLSVPSPQTKATTIPATDGEEQIRSLYLLFFDYSTGGTGEFVNYYDASPLDGNPLNLDEVINIEFEEGSGLYKSSFYNILLVANIDSYIEEDNITDWFTKFTGITENEAILYFTVSVTGADNDNSQAISSQNLPMSGVTVKNKEDELVQVELVRMVSRFDVFNYDTDYTLVSASIWNAYPKTFIWENSYNTYMDERLERFYGVEAIENSIEGGLYSFMNYVASPLQNDKQTTCLIVGLDKGDGTRYYRANLNSTGVFHQLKRNCAYKLHIRKVLGKGAESEKDAYTGEELLLDMDINGWTVPDQGSVITDGENILVLPTLIIPFTPKAETRNFTVFARGEGYLEISQKELPAGITAELTPNPETGFGLLTVSVTESPDPLSGFIEIKFGKLKGIITITQSGSNEQFLTLSKSVLPVFPSAPAQLMEGEIEVTSSGDWTAQIYNGKFEFHNNATLLHGSDGERFSVQTVSSNTAPDSWYSFILITLDENTEIQRAMVLTQNGSGDIILIPADQTRVTFDPFGTPTSNNQFAVVVEAGAEWDIDIYGSYASKFAIEEDQNESSVFRVVALPNPDEQSYTAILRAKLKNVQTIYKEVELYQAAHILQVSPLTLQVQPQGGYSDYITVFSTAEWKAEISDQIDFATFENGSTEITGQPNTSFRVNFDDNLTSPVKREVQVRIYIPETTKQTFIKITQLQGVSKSSLTLFSTSGSYGSLSVDAQYIQQFRNSLQNTSTPNNSANTYKFGPDDKYTVYRPATWTNTKTGTSGQPYGGYIRRDANIVCWNAGTPDRGYLIRGWLFGGEDGFSYPDDIRDRVLLWWGDLEATRMAQRFQTDKQGANFTDLGYTGQKDRNIAPTYDNKINEESIVINSKIVKYLIDGPFGKVTNIQDIGFFGHDATNGTLTRWPDTMIPIIKYENEVVLGIDPTTHIVFCGNTEIFHGGQWLPASNTNKNFDGQTARGKSNQIFMDNLIAWIINTAIYGEYFTNDFID